jgi:Rps23 Pro-64 3,4-dihydroxylase Tpa1-like proline 4-hydroxylase
MINFDDLLKNSDRTRQKFLNNSPFEHIVIDNFCNENKLEKALNFIPDARTSGHRKSNDYIFAKNKFEKADFDLLCPQFKELKNELLSQKFSSWLFTITGHKIFIDPKFHGGGLHQGGQSSFLDMHADFNYHPENRSWFRNVNILLYLNKDWKPDYAGQLKLVDGRNKNGKPYLIEPVFNRAVIMFTRDYTLHGYDAINFPSGTYRTSIAAYGYTETGEVGKLRTTVWKPEKSSIFKRFLGKHMPKLVSAKTRLFGSGTTKNK